LSSAAFSHAGITEQPAPRSGLPPDLRQSAGLRRWWWLGALLAVASILAGGTVVHIADQRHAQRVLYDIQVLTTASRFLDEERSQIALPVAQRNAGALGDLADSINADLGVNGEDTCSRTLPGRASRNRPGADRLALIDQKSLKVRPVQAHPAQPAHTDAVPGLLQGAGLDLTSFFLRTG
jgi:hypothetical protein